MATREELYQKFGPKLVDAVVQVILDEINILRVEAGLSERTGPQVVDVLNAKVDSIPNYDWMDQ